METPPTFGGVSVSEDVPWHPGTIRFNNPSDCGGLCFEPQ
jgi:hypothetical protein